MPGPAPKPKDQRRRRNADPVSAVQLPAEGRQGKPPPWPLPGESKDETAVWREVWKTPQAVAWERLGWNRVVARYVRRLVEAEQTKSGAAVNAEVRQLEDRLGLSPMAMLRLRWEIVADEMDEKRQTGAPRRRLKAVDPDAVAGT